MDAAAGIGIPVAFGAGLISFLSPCVLPLVPGYISAVAGVRETADLKARRVIGPTLAFVGSFSAIFIALGLLGGQAIRGAVQGRHGATRLRRADRRDGRAVRTEPADPETRARVARAVADGARRSLRPGSNRRRLRDRLDPLHRPDARRDRQRDGDLIERLQGRLPAGDLLPAGAGSAVPDHRSRLRQGHRLRSTSSSATTPGGDRPSAA